MARKKETLEEQLTRLRIYVQSLRGTWFSLADEAGLSYAWIRTFARGDIANPGHDKIVALEAHSKQYGNRPRSKKAKRKVGAARR